MHNAVVGPVQQGVSVRQSTVPQREQLFNNINADN
jgi:hypothetical protein